MQIIDGYCGVPNIYADDIGEYNISMYGEGDYVLPVGEKLGYELVSNNEVKIKDGFFITQGRRGLIKKGSTESCAIENGTQDEKRNDLIVIEYAKDGVTQEESHTLKVIKGTPGAEAADPEVVTGDIPGGDVLHQMPLYRVKLDGLNVTAVEQLFERGSIAPETVDPMLATEAGFAADAKATGDALKSQNSKIDSIWSKIYPVGSIYMSTSSANPGTLFGGTWQQITGRFLLAAGGGYSAGATGGEAAHTLTVSEMPAHSHQITTNGSLYFIGNGVGTEFEMGSWASRSLAMNYTTVSAGGNGAHNNMPPYIVVYMWKRTA